MINPIQALTRKQCIITMANQLMKELCSVRNNFISIYEKIPVEDIGLEENGEYFDGDVAHVVIEDCKHLIELIELRHRDVFTEYSEILLSFAQKIKKLESMRIPDHCEVDEFLTNFLNSVDGIGGILLNLKVDVDYLAKYLVHINEEMQNSLRSEGATRKKRAYMLSLEDYFKTYNEKYAKVYPALRKVLDFASSALGDQGDSITVIDNAIQYINTIDNGIFDDESYIDHYLESFLKPNEEIERILMKSLEEDGVDGRRSSCFYELMSYREETVEVEASLAKLFDFLDSFYRDFYFFQELKLSNSVDLLYSNDQKLQTIESKIRQVMSENQ